MNRQMNAVTAVRANRRLTKVLAATTVVAMSLLGFIGIQVAGQGVAAAAAPVSVTTCSGDSTVPGSLPYVVANASSGDSINFSVICDSSSPITVTTPMDITQDLTIIGSGVADTVVSGGDAVGIFTVTNGAIVSISDMTLEHGSALNGGAIDLADGDAGALTVSNSAFVANSAGADGGAIDAGDNAGTATLTVTGSTFTGNTGADEGGAIDNADYGGTSSATVTGSTFSGNSVANYDGGAIANGDDDGFGTLVVSTSTFSDNSSGTDPIPGQDAGASAINNGWWSTVGVATTTITGSTFSNNNALGTNGAGSTISNGSESGATTSIGTSILSGATGGRGECNSAAQPTDLSYNISDDASCGFTATGSVNSSSTLVASLGALANNGGPTDTILPSVPSPVIGAIPETTIVNSTLACPTTDQRGATSSGACTIGSVQLPWTTPDAPTSVSAIAVDTSASVSFTAPAFDGGSPITGYTVTALDSTTPGNGGQTAPGGSSPIDVTGLTNGDSYTFTVVATNINGDSSPGGPSSAVVPKASQTITFTTTAPTGVVVGSSGYTPAATASSSLTVAITLDGTSSGCSLSGGVVSFTAVGTCVIDANQVGNANYTAAPQVQQSIIVAAVTPIPTPTPPASTTGYRLVTAAGQVSCFGGATCLGDLSGLHLNKPIVGIVATATGKGYWLVATDGGIFAIGDAVFYGSTGALALNKPIVGMAATSAGMGYWLVASDGGIFAFGDAVFYGSMGANHLNKPIVGMTPTADGKGYWLVASDGGIFAIGDAAFFGSTGALKLNKPIVGMAATSTGLGYWLVASDGGVFAFGDAVFYGSTGSLALNKPIVGMSATADGKGYWMVATDGGIFNFGDATFLGSNGGQSQSSPTIGIAAS